MDPKGKIAVVTGAAGGIGGALVRELVKAGAATVVATDIRVEGLDAFADEPNVLARPLDVSDDTATHQLVESIESEVGPIDLWFANAGVAGGAGCALHLAAIDAGESPIDWKPSVCWQLPIRVDWEAVDDHTEVATVRRWTRDDWGEEGETMAWCCTEGDLAYVGEQRVIDSLQPELEEIVGRAVYVQLRQRLTEST